MGLGSPWSRRRLRFEGDFAAKAFQLVDQQTSVVFDVLGVAAVEELPRRRRVLERDEGEPQIPACERLPISYEPSLPAERGQSFRTGDDGSLIPEVNCQRSMDSLPTTEGPVAAAGSHPTPTKHPRAREERERPRKSAGEHRQQASAEIDKARQEATADVRRSLDGTLARMRAVSGVLRQRAEDQTAEWHDVPKVRLGARWAAAGSACSARPRRSRGSLTRSASRRPSWGRRRRRATVPRANRRSPAGGTGPPAKGCVEYRIHSAAGGAVAVLPESVRPVVRVEARWPRSTSWS